VDQAEAPVANDDEVTASRETPTDIRILDNDVIPRDYIRSLNLVDGTLLIGTIDILPDNSLEFIPGNDTCGITDTVQYVICNNTGCDTANVMITLPCAAQPTLVYNGFSPNGDGVNDKFVIGGIAEGEKVELQVFDRWGNRVYLSTKYSNDWEGTFDNKALPDGTYYWYLVRESGQIDGGYVELRR
jgi:gliding motility-associated-like protein